MVGNVKTQRTRKLDLLNQTLGLWTVISPLPNADQGVMWLCVCPEGHEYRISATVLRGGYKRKCNECCAKPARQLLTSETLKRAARSFGQLTPHQARRWADELDKRLRYFGEVSESDRLELIDVCARD